jgi:hypothetical protein
LERTLKQYGTVIERCRQLFLDKTADYGTAWRILRTSSLTDQLYIKAARIRTIEEKGTQKVSDSVDGEFVGLVNYSVLAILQGRLPQNAPLEFNPEEVMSYFDGITAESIELMKLKNHDYGEIWRDMRVSSMTDLILMKILRIKQIENLKGKTKVSEGVEANYFDIINYAVFALIKLSDN